MTDSDAVYTRFTAEMPVFMSQVYDTLVFYVPEYERVRASLIAHARPAEDADKVVAELMCVVGKRLDAAVDLFTLAAGDNYDLFAAYMKRRARHCLEKELCDRYAVLGSQEELPRMFQFDRIFAALKVQPLPPAVG